MDQKEADFEDEESEFREVRTTMQRQGGLGKNNDEQPFYIRHADRRAKYAACRALAQDA